MRNSEFISLIWKKGLEMVGGNKDKNPSKIVFSVVFFIFMVYLQHNLNIIFFAL